MICLKLTIRTKREFRPRSNVPPSRVPGTLEIPKFLGQWDTGHWKIPKWLGQWDTGYWKIPKFLGQWDTEHWKIPKFLENSGLENLQAGLKIMELPTDDVPEAQ